MSSLLTDVYKDLYILSIFSNVQFFYISKTGKCIHAEVLNIVEAQVPWKQITNINMTKDVFSWWFQENTFEIGFRIPQQNRAK